MIARIVVLNWNGKAFLHSCLTALLPLTIGRAEVMLVDNAFDGSVAFVRQYFPAVQIAELPAADWLSAVLEAAASLGRRALMASKAVFLDGMSWSIPPGTTIFAPAAPRGAGTAGPPPLCGG